MPKKNPKTLCLVAGGSGGHIIPALTIGEKWKQNNPDGSIIFFVNTVKDLDKKIVGQSNQIDQKIFIRLINIPGKKLWLYPKFIFQFFASLIKSLFVFLRNKPTEIISTGGHIALPVCFASFILRIPINLYELNFVPGKAIKALSYLATNIFLTFKKSDQFFGARKNKCIPINYPLKYTKKDLEFDKSKTIRSINLKTFDANKKTLFVLGGSQGSIFINNLIKTWLKENHSDNLSNIQIIHQTGDSDQTDWDSFYKQFYIPVFHFKYSDQIKEFYQISDLVICRGGAGTLFELEFFKKKALIIPLETSYTNHQLDNAIAMAIQNDDLFTVIRKKDILQPLEIKKYLLLS